jgi:very-short-patch-repair endonuclease
VPVLVELLGRRMDGRPPPTNRFERRLEAMLMRRGLAAPVRQVEIELDGRVMARPDLAYPELQIAIEADSYRWHGGRSAWEHDLARRTELAAAGWLVLHFSWRDLIERPKYVVAQVARTVDLRRSAP